jgi:hypothetical protein
LACQGDVVKYVTQQILDGQTENNWYSGRSIGASATAWTGLDWACREVAKRSGEVAKAEIEALERALAKSEKRYSDLLSEQQHRAESRY